MRNMDGRTDRVIPIYNRNEGQTQQTKTVLQTEWDRILI